MSSKCNNQAFETPSAQTTRPVVSFAPPRGGADEKATLDELEAIIETQTMMRFGPERRAHLLSTVTTRARNTGASSVSEYARKLIISGRDPELMLLVDALTINVTTFFRNVPQLELFSLMLPEIVKRKTAANEPKEMRIWSAGCSTGQEVYTLAGLATDALRSYPGWTFTVLGSDLSTTVLSVARGGRYPKVRLSTMPPDALQRHFDVCGDEIQAKGHLRSRVSFVQHNLRNTFPEGRFDVIFCRNVMIYFSREDQARLASQFASRLTPEGFLFIGHSESLQGLADNFRLRIEAGGVAYQKRAE